MTATNASSTTNGSTASRAATKSTGSGATLLPTRSRGTQAVVLIAGAAITVAANIVVALSAHAAGASSAFAPLNVAVFAPFSVLGFFAGYAGWRIIRRRSGRPARTLAVLIPVLTVLSFIPDTVLAVTGFIPDSSVTAVVGLALMHLVVVATVVPVAAKLAPVR